MKAILFLNLETKKKIWSNWVLVLQPKPDKKEKKTQMRSISDAAKLKFALPPSKSWIIPFKKIIIINPSSLYLTRLQQKWIQSPTTRLLPPTSGPSLASATTTLLPSNLSHLSEFFKLEHQFPQIVLRALKEDDLTQRARRRERDVVLHPRSRRSHRFLWWIWLSLISDLVSLKTQPLQNREHNPEAEVGKLGAGAGRQDLWTSRGRVGRRRHSGLSGWVYGFGRVSMLWVYRDGSL